MSVLSEGLPTQTASNPPTSPTSLNPASPTSNPEPNSVITCFKIHNAPTLAVTGLLKPCAARQTPSVQQTKVNKTRSGHTLHASIRSGLHNNGEMEKWRIGRIGRIPFGWVQIYHRIWRQKQERHDAHCLKRGVQYAASLMVWRCVSARAVGSVCFLTPKNRSEHGCPHWNCRCVPYRISMCGECVENVWRWWLCIPARLCSRSWCPEKRKIPQRKKHCNTATTTTHQTEILQQ